ncbi:MAG TPA: chloride channel protein [Kofleriaceae bacterium]|nr:chloride channel protein [Kofleriaceae bacterium]
MTTNEPDRIGVVLRPVKTLLALVTPAEQPLELQIVGRTLLHAAIVGLSAGILGCAFFAGAELLASVLLEQLAGYEPLRAHGEKVWGAVADGAFRPWLLFVIPAIGALIGGLITRLAPECRGGGGDATIEAFHHQGGVVRKRVLWVKGAASIATLGTGGSGGREGPTMQIGGALGSLVGHYLGVGARERRVLYVAGIAAGISAVFRAPLGAALIAIEMLYRDDFESEALVPAVLASVIAYSVSISVFGQATLFGHLEPYHFAPRHIPLYILLAIVISAGGALFVASLRLSQRTFKTLKMPEWVRPGIGGLMLGVFVVIIIHFVGSSLGRADQGLGVLGGGYGAAQVAITGADWMPLGWTGVEILLLLAAAKIVASSFTIGSGGSAGDFAPALAIGALLGGAFGLAARIVFDDPTIQPGAFALVGMGTFYGGIANTPLAALVLVAEMAGSYDLLVPLMLAEGVAFVALRRVSLYPAQLPTLHDSPVHQRPIDRLAKLSCRDVLATRAFQSIGPDATVAELSRLAEGAPDQDVFPVVDRAGALRGLVSAEALRVVASNPEVGDLAIVADVMKPAASVRVDQDLRAAAQIMVASDLRSIPVIDPSSGAIVGMLDEHEVSSMLVKATL